ncbi:MAG: hypothetical protein IK115_02865 [Lachnospiraceae bacterium]|nr:hypothetical protein [Lachnospiraceae bacterium]
MKKLLQVSFICALILCGCGSKPAVSGNDTPVVQTKPQATVTPAPTAAPEPYVIACDEFGGNFDPLYAGTSSEREIASLLNASLYDISDRTESTAADGTVSYEFTLHEGVKFSDGESVSPEDVIFTFYLLSDPAYRGSNAFCSLPVKGMDEYRVDSRSLLELLLAAGAENTQFGYFTEEQQTRFFETDLPKAGADFAQSIADYCIANDIITEIDSIDSCPIANAMVNWGYGLLSADGSVTGQQSGSVWTMQGSAVPSARDFYEEMLAAYKGDVEKMAEKEKADKELTDFIPEEYKRTVGAGISAAKIAGVELSESGSVKLTLASADDRAEELMNVPVLPLHYYGDPDYFDPAKNHFGIHKGELGAVEALTSAPLGAGAYVLASSDEESVRLEGNPEYYGETPEKEVLVYKAVPTEQRAAAISAGVVDEALMPATKELLENPPEGATLSLEDMDAYDYIGFSAERFAISGNSASEESRALRKAIATVMSVYREEAVEAYYGEAAVLIDYPVAADGRDRIPADDPAYETAFDRDVKGTPIYNEGMTQQQKEAAALKAAAGFLEAAGFTFEEGVITGAPKGAKLSYEVMLIGGGVGDEVSFQIVADAAEALAGIGLELTIRDISDPAALAYALEGGHAEIWCGSWEEGTIPELMKYYYSECRNANMHRIFDDELDELIRAEAAEKDPGKKDSLYRQVLDVLMDEAVVLPVDRRQAARLTR